MTSVLETRETPSASGDVKIDEYYRALFFITPLLTGISPWREILVLLAEIALLLAGFFYLHKILPISELTGTLVTLAVYFFLAGRRVGRRRRSFVATALRRGVPSVLSFHYDLTETGVSGTCDDVRFFAPWHKLDELAVTHRSLVLFAKNAHVLVLRSHFKSTEDEARFIAYAYAHMSEAARARSKEAAAIAATADGAE